MIHTLTEKDALDRTEKMWLHMSKLTDKQLKDLEYVGATKNFVLRSIMQVGGFVMNDCFLCEFNVQKMAESGEELFLCEYCPLKYVLKPDSDRASHYCEARGGVYAMACANLANSQFYKFRARALDIATMCGKAKETL